MTNRVNPINIEEKIDSGLLQISTNFLFDEIQNDNIKMIIKWIVYENTIKSTQPITLYINSIGGSLIDALALIDVMKKSKRKVRTIGIGSICSAAFLIFASGEKGERYIGKNTSIMCHQFTDEITGKHHDLKAQYRETQLNEQRMLTILTEATGLNKQTIRKTLMPPTDVWLTSAELIELKIADKYLEDLK